MPSYPHTPRKIASEYVTVVRRPRDNAEVMMMAGTCTAIWRCNYPPDSGIARKIRDVNRETEPPFRWDDSGPGHGAGRGGSVAADPAQFFDVVRERGRYCRRDTEEVSLVLRSSLLLPLFIIPPTDTETPRYHIFVTSRHIL